MKHLVEHIRTQSSNKNEIFSNETLIYLQNKLPFSLKLDNLIKTIKYYIPNEFFNNIDNIFIGNYKEFEKKDVNAFYLNRAIYVTSNQSSEEDLLEDIIHEIAHSVEEEFELEIYSDGRLANEFLSKRKKLYYILTSEGYKLDVKYVNNIDYDIKFDKWLYKKVGYPKLSQLTSNLFLSPYAITSLREYFADGFEDYFYFKNQQYIKNISPVLYEKLEQLYEMTI